MKVLFLLIALVLLAGCESMPKRDPAFAPVEPAQLTPPPSNNGAIYQAGYDMRLWEDHTARRVGDMLTVKLVERMDASKDADLDVSKEQETTVEVPVILGKEGRRVLGYELDSSLRSSKDFQGEGEANQSNSLEGDITVTVVEVLPNGYLKIRGEKRVTLNQGHEYVRLSGIVRPVDIDVTNTVESTRVADATIMYTGEGAMADGSKMGWLARFFNSPYFPF